MNPAVHTDMVEYFDRLLGFFGRAKYDDFHSAVAGRRWSHRLFYFVANVMVRHRITAALMSYGLYLTLPGLVRIPRADVVFFGSTHNNLRALDEVKGLLADHSGLRITHATRRARLLERLRKPHAIRLILDGSALVAGSRRDAPFLAMQLVVGVAAYAFYHDPRLSGRAKVVVLANDHSPVPSALLFGARRYGIATVYRQHAPVTVEFPPLRCDLALLYDHASADHYRAHETTTSSPHTRIEILSPFAESYRPIEPERPVHVIGLCLSLVWVADAVELLIEELLASSSVAQIIVRTHPANRQDLDRLLSHPQLALDEAGRTVGDFSSRIDLAIVPNSGICVELLHHGVPVAYRAGLDALGHDLYGFVAERIIPDYTGKPLLDLDRISAFFDASWKERFARLDATQSHSITAMSANARSALYDTF